MFTYSPEQKQLQEMLLEDIGALPPHEGAVARDTDLPIIAKLEQVAELMFASSVASHSPSAFRALC